MAQLSWGGSPAIWQMNASPYPLTPVGSNLAATSASAAGAGSVAAHTLLMSPPHGEKSAATMTPVEQPPAAAPAGGQGRSHHSERTQTGHTRGQATAVSSDAPARPGPGGPWGGSRAVPRPPTRRAGPTIPRPPAAPGPYRRGGTGLTAIPRDGSVQRRPPSDPWNPASPR